MQSQKSDLRFTDGWARRERPGPLRRGRLVLDQVLDAVKSTTIPRLSQLRGGILLGLRETAIAMQLLQGGTIQRRGTTEALINGPVMTNRNGPGADGSADWMVLGADPPARATLIGAMCHGVGRHPVPTQEGPRGAWCLVQLKKS